MRRVLIVAAATLISASVAHADWAGHFKALDADGNGAVSRTEYEAGVAKLGLDPAPTFTSMDQDVNNRIDADEWAAAEKQTTAYSESCKSTTASWCE
ncbi:hypothetical protein [Hyphomicrobium sp.]|uniref:hypothetical protein n=1 Tax=Hyphomicrobium sp. TaxID=82 RepID=UPI002CE8530E|nr:hypothetical protein [Hyphomicrobium sp.]HRN87881.1 hypothetical protein [Hyphomicrobium sp.]HRQ27195.1 hypothetical protein [Hyphomicrobium sp.]